MSIGYIKNSYDSERKGSRGCRITRTKRRGLRSQDHGRDEGGGKRGPRGSSLLGDCRSPERVDLERRTARLTRKHETSVGDDGEVVSRRKGGRGCEEWRGTDQVGQGSSVLRRNGPCGSTASATTSCGLAGPRRDIVQGLRGLTSAGLFSRCAHTARRTIPTSNGGPGWGAGQLAGHKRRSGLALARRSRPPEPKRARAVAQVWKGGKRPGVCAGLLPLWA